MQTLDAIFTRRSVRRFTDEPISAEIKDKLLRAAMNAPSAHNHQTWQFVVVDDRKILDELSTQHPHAKMCEQAPMAIVCCHDLSLDEIVGLGVQNVSAAIQNILLAARDFNLGAVWLGVYPKENLMEKMRQLFEIPEAIVPVGIVALGHSDMDQAFIDRYNEERVHHNRW